MQTRLPKTKRAPDAFADAKITDRSLAVIETIGRYRFILARDIVRVVGGNEDVTHRHLQQLFHRDLISRFNLPVGPNRGEFVYFLDNAAELRKLCTGSKLNQKSFDWDEISRNRQKYSLAADRSPGQLLFIDHELMISRFHADIETSCRADGNVVLERWVQGSALWNTVQVDSARALPHRPDALFALKFLSAPEGQQRATFLYEADRETSSLLRIQDKFEGHIAFLVQEKALQWYGARRIRAVLVETTGEKRTQQLREVAAELGQALPIANRMFWFSTIDTRNSEDPLKRRTWICSGDNICRSLHD
jgi:hypothetical protein